jgi:hypothetical protein
MAAFRRDCSAHCAQTSDCGKLVPERTAVKAYYSVRRSTANQEPGSGSPQERDSEALSRT